MTIPITVFTGFLGAGKTSIILSLLPKLPKDYKVVLLKNEFGDVEGQNNDRAFWSPLITILTKFSEQSTASLPRQRLRTSQR